MTLYALGEHAPSIHADTWIADDANVIGQVVMEQGSSVWFGATIRADHEIIHIGAGVNVQENTVMHIDQRLSFNDWCWLHDWTQSHVAWVHDWSEFLDWYGGNRVERRGYWRQLPDRRRRFDHRRQGDP